MKTIGEKNETRLHFEPVGTPVEIKQSLDEATTRACEELGRAMGERLEIKN